MASSSSARSAASGKPGLAGLHDTLTQQSLTPQIPDPYSEPQPTLAEIKEAFDLFDKDSEGTVLRREIGLILRALGYQITDRQITQIELSLKDAKLELHEVADVCDAFRELCMSLPPELAAEQEKIQREMRDVWGRAGVSDGRDTTGADSLARKTALPPTSYEKQQEKVINAFSLFDITNTGEVSIEELRHVLTSVGEKMTAEEIDEALKLMGNSLRGNNTRVDYADFIKGMVL